MHAELSTINIAPTSTHKYSVIWLHGLGADGHDFESIVPSLNLTAEANTHFIFPNAPIQSVTINNHMKMRSWYDILSMSLDGHAVDITGIYQSSDLVYPLIQKEIEKGISPANILLAGFSQGGAIALHAGLRYPQKLAGILALSTYHANHRPSSAMKVLQRVSLRPIFMAHGILDAVIAIEAGKINYSISYQHWATTLNGMII